MRVVLHLFSSFVILSRADAFDVGHAKNLPGWIVRDSARKPTHRDQPAQSGLARIEIENGHGILRAIADEEFLAAAVERKRIRLRPEEVGWIQTRPDRFDQLVGFRIKDR